MANKLEEEEIRLALECIRRSPHARKSILLSLLDKFPDSPVVKTLGGAETLIEKQIIHKKCGQEMVVKPNMFYLRGHFYSGLVCEKCNALFGNPDDSFEEYIQTSKTKL